MRVGISSIVPARAFNINITRWLEQRSLVFRGIFGLGILAATIVADLFISREISFSIFYLIPVSYFAWFFAPWAGIVVSIFSLAAWMLIGTAKHPQYSTSAIPYWNDLINLALFLTVVYILGEVKTIYLSQRSQAQHDYLTGVWNARALYDALSAERNRASRYGLITTLAYLDLDNFKKVNDSFGHETGNELLILVAQAISRNVRNTDFVARVGGDEFCILMPHTDSEAAKSLLGKIQDLLLSEMTKRNWPVTLSIGGVTFVRPPKSAHEMIEAADALMYSVKSTGKNRIAQTVLPSGTSPMGG